MPALPGRATSFSPHPDARIGVVVPGLAALRNPIDRTFRRILMPASEDLRQPSSPMPWEFSLGQPLAEVPAIRAALLLLRWVAAPLSRGGDFLARPLWICRRYCDTVPRPGPPRCFPAQYGPGPAHPGTLPRKISRLADQRACSARTVDGSWLSAAGRRRQSTPRYAAAPLRSCRNRPSPARRRGLAGRALAGLRAVPGPAALAAPPR